MSAPRHLTVTAASREAAADAAVEALAAGQLVVLPTDTVYGLAARADDRAALALVFEAKRRSRDRPVPILLASFEHFERVAPEASRAARVLAWTFWPGPLTLVVPRPESVPFWVSGGAATVGLRVPDDETALLVLSRAPFLVAVTSANLSDEPTAATAAECAAALALAPAVVLEDGPRPSRASTVVAVSDGDVEVLRPGPITLAQIRAALR